MDFSDLGELVSSYQEGAQRESEEGIYAPTINPGNPASSATSGAGTPLMIGPLTIAEIDQLNGFRFFMFEVTITYPSPPNIAPGETLPFMDDITVNCEN